MFKNTGTLRYDLHFSLISIWHILWLKRGSRYACMHVLTCVSIFICYKHESRYKCLLWAYLSATDNFPGDVETSAYTPEYSKYLFFFWISSWWAGCVYTIMPLHDCVYIQMHVFRGSIRLLICVPWGGVILFCITDCLVGWWNILF